MKKKTKITYRNKTLEELREEYIRRGIDGAGKIFISALGWKVDRTKDIYAKHMDFDGNAFIIQNCPDGWGIVNEDNISVYGMGRVNELNYLKFRLMEDDLKQERKN